MVQAYLGRYAGLWARACWAPAIGLHAALEPSLATARRVRGALHLGDIKSALRSWLDAGAVPDVYFQLGEKVHHWLIDEFQDTSPLQWKILFPLVENSLASGAACSSSATPSRRSTGSGRRTGASCTSSRSGTPSRPCGATSRPSSR